ncbi:STAS domain-containing protein [Mycobacterium sp.]|uniref:STAS domain-containing protein n=1 Tax=Mycobacterium sp. TaxID=1785 RepID=UPI0031D26112
MTNSIGTADSLGAPRDGNPLFDCGGAMIRAQCRHLATVVKVSGAIDAANVDRVGEYCRRFILPDNGLILDFTEVDCISAQGMRLIYRLAEDCGALGVQWELVVGPAVARVLTITDGEAGFPVAGSVHEALHHFADVTSARRRLLLPMLTKTA